ncbi:MAG: hypothetical protein GX660_16970, partial [Clostridiaceae bacterium]|nr:hypothetical protein [Clostridiaceae bacterium]
MLRLPCSSLTIVIYYILVLPVLGGSLTFSASTKINQWSFYFSENDSNEQLVSNLAQDSFQKILVPHSFNLNETFGKHKTGYGWYMTTIVLDSVEGNQHYLQFEGVCLRAEIFINGQLAGKCNKSYLPFQLDITNFVNDKKSIKVLIKVDNRLLKNSFPDFNCDGWWIYGGLIRDILYVSAPKKRIDNVQFRTFYTGDDKFRLTYDFETIGIKPDSVRLIITDKEKVQIFNKCIDTRNNMN